MSDFLPRIDRSPRHIAVLQRLDGLYPSIGNSFRRLIDSTMDSVEAFDSEQPGRSLSPSRSQALPPPEAEPLRLPLRYHFNEHVPLDLYLAEALASWKRHKAGATNLPRSHKHFTSCADDKHPIMAPSRLCRGLIDRLNSMLAAGHHDLLSVHGLTDDLLPRFQTHRNLHPSFDNEHMLASLIQTHVVEPASKILNAAATIAGRAVEHLPFGSSGLVDTLHAKICIHTITEVSLRPHLHDIRTPLYRVHPSDLYHIIRADPTSNAPTPVSDLQFSPAEREKQLQLWLKQTRPDLEIVMEDTQTGALERILSVEAKRRDAFTADAIRSVFGTGEDAFTNRALCRKVKADGCYHLQDIFRHEFWLKGNGMIFTPVGRYLSECVAQQWKYMAARGQTWGIVTCGWASIVLEIDWTAGARLGDVVYFYILDKDDHVLPQSDGGAQVTLPIQEILALLARANVVAGLKDNDLFVRLCEKTYEANETYDPSQTPLPKRFRHSTSVADSSASSADTSTSTSASTSATDTANAVASLTWTTDNRLRKLIARATAPDRPKVRFAFSPQQRLDAIIRARATFQANSDDFDEVYEDLQIVLEAASHDPFTNLIRRRARETRRASRSSGRQRMKNAIRQRQLVVLSPKLQSVPGPRRRRRSSVGTIHASRIKVAFATSRKRPRSGGARSQNPEMTRCEADTSLESLDMGDR